MQRVAVLSMHTSPLAQAGVGDGGGMNVYVRELVSSLANLGVECTTYTRRWRDDLPREVQIEPNHRVVHVPAGPLDLPKEGLIGVVDFVLQRMWGLHRTAADRITVTPRRVALRPAATVVRAPRPARR